MKTLLAGLACGALLLAGAVSAQPGQTANDNSSSHGSAVNPTPPASDTRSTPASTASTGGEKTHKATRRTKCRKQADEQNLTGKARKDYLHTCNTESAPQ